MDGAQASSASSSAWRGAAAEVGKGATGSGQKDAASSPGMRECPRVFE